MQFQFLILLIATTTLSTSYAQVNLVRSGSYEIRYCGTGPDSKAATLQALLPMFRSKLLLVQADAQKGTESKAFRAFFRNQSNAPYVQGVFKHMAEGRQAMIPGQGGATGHVRFENPNLVCLNPTMPGYETLRQQCGSTSIATTRRNRALVLLCRPYWGLDEEPDGIDCPVVRRNVFTQNNDDRIMRNQFATFVHEMAHAYTASWIPASGETKGIMDCVKLNAGASVKNVQSYALYAASEFVPLTPPCLLQSRAHFVCMGLSLCRVTDEDVCSGCGGLQQIPQP